MCEALSEDVFVSFAALMFRSRAAMFASPPLVICVPSSVVLPEDSLLTLPPTLMVDTTALLDALFELLSSEWYLMFVPAVGPLDADTAPAVLPFCPSLTAVPTP